jgi:hypothetical protein
MDGKISVGVVAFSNTTVNLNRLALGLEKRIPDISVISKVVVPLSKQLLAWNSVHPADIGGDWILQVAASICSC